jgi:hypothetical protein
MRAGQRRIGSQKSQRHCEAVCFKHIKKIPGPMGTVKFAMRPALIYRKSWVRSQTMRKAGQILMLSLVVVTVWCAAISSSWAGERVSASRFIGADKCKACHPGAYKQWRATIHAKAMVTLDSRDRGDVKCLQCHATNPEEVEAALDGVQCEACHGAGQYYALEYVMRDRELREALGFRKGDEKSCLKCHDEGTPSLKPFSFGEKYDLIRHSDKTDSPPTSEKPAGETR